MSIAINPELEARLRAQAEAQELTVEAFLERIVSRRERAEAELARLIEEGIASGNPIVPDEAYWENKLRRVEERLSKIAPSV